MTPHVIFGIGWGELAFLLVMFVVLFGPEKLPGYARKAARVVAWARNFATAATTQLKSELGPEYQDLTVQDLNPKTFVTKHLLSEVQSDIAEVREELTGVKADLGVTAAAVATVGNDVKTTLNTATTSTAVKKISADDLNWDSEAT